MVGHLPGGCPFKSIGTVVILGMLLEKNSQLINRICKVQIRSVDGVVDIPTLADIYHTPSSIQYTISSSRTKNGPLHTKTLRLGYPGLSEDDFSKFDTLLRGVYQVMVKLQDNKVYEVSNSRYPMSCSTSYNIGTGHEVVFTVASPLNITYIGVDDSGITGKPGIFDEQFDYYFDFNLA